MRLTCPNCTAVYEVPEDAIPPEGREVECSNCGTTWFQPGADGAPVAEPETPPPGAAPHAGPDGAGPPDDPADAPVPRVRQRPRDRLSEEDEALLRDEAERESALRRRAPRPEPAPDAAEAETPPPAPEPAPDPAPAPAPAAAAPVPRPVQRRIGDATPPGEEDEEPKVFRRELGRDRLPDIEEINTSLTTREAGRGSGLSPQAAEKRRGFRLGFAGALLIAALLVGLYASAPRLAASVPVLAGPLGAYETQITRLRLGLDRMVRRAAEGLQPAE